MMPDTPEMDAVLPARQAETIIGWIVEALEAAEVPTARGDAEIIVAHALGLTRADVQSGAASGIELDDDQIQQVLDFTQRRTRREPLQHLTGKSLFRSLELEVGPGVFIPRRETEFVAELAIRSLQASAAPDPIAIDAGAGAGAIALALATEVPSSTVYAIELEESAHRWLERNVARIAPDRAHAVLGDMIGALPELQGRVDVVAGNPPWIPDGTASPTPEVALFETGARIYGGGSDGLDVMRGLSQTALRWLKPGGAFVTEHGVSMGPRVAALLEGDGWLDVQMHVDPRGKQRVASARRP